MPSNPKENTIWINTDTAIGEWQVSASQPTARTDGTALQTGDVWVESAVDSITHLYINILKKSNGIILPITNVYVYNGSKFVANFDVQIYTNGEWVDIVHYVYFKGLNAADNHGGSASFGTSSFTVSSYHWSDVFHDFIVDLTNFKTLVLNVTARSGSNPESKFYVTSQDGATTYVSSTWFGTGRHRFDVSKASGLCRIKVGIKAAKDYDTCSLTVDEISCFTE